MRIAVTGGSGFIGSHLVDRLLAEGHEVIVVDTRAPHRGEVHHRPVDVLDLPGLVRATRGCDVIFHLAAVSDVNEAANDPVAALDVNVTGTARVWEAARRNGVGRAVLASTVWVYAGARGEGVLDEEAPFDLARAGHIYTSSKIASEMVVHSYFQLYEQSFTILRYGIPYGPRMRDELVIPRFVRMALAGEAITVHGDGSQYRNYVYVDDLVDGHVRVLGDVAANDAFNLEGTEVVSVRRIVECIRDVLDRSIAVELGGARPGDYAGREVSAEKARRVLGWEPRIPFEEGLRRYVAWYLEETADQLASGG